jgi:hypothetical protein
MKHAVPGPLFELLADDDPEVGQAQFIAALRLALGLGPLDGAKCANVRRKVK